MQECISTKTGQLENFTKTLRRNMLFLSCMKTKKCKLLDLKYFQTNLFLLSECYEPRSLKTLMNEVSCDETTSSINKCIEQWEQKSECCPKCNKSVLQKQQGKADAETLRPKSRQNSKTKYRGSVLSTTKIQLKDEEED